MSQMQQILILADDLTGAADTASRCRAAGLSATIFLTPPRPSLPAGVVAFTSDSRHLPPAEAAARTRAVAAPLADQPAIWYKKIDSTLRGNIGSELDALLDLLDTPAALVCPAFPTQGRGLRKGSLIAPNLSAEVHLPTLLRQQSRYPVLSFSLEDVRSGALAERFQRRAAEAQSRRGGWDRLVFVVDGMTDEDLGWIVDAAEAVPGLLLCGSAGLIGEVAKRQGQKEDLPGFGKPGRSESKTLIVVGSGSPVAHRQIDGLLAAHPAAPRLVLEANSVNGTAPVDAPLVLIHQPPPLPGTPLDGPDARRRAELLADAALVQIGRMQPGLLILVGGDTAVAVLSRLGVDQLTVQTELLPGMPLCTAQVNGRSLQVVMKPGSFGDEETLARLLTLAHNAQ